MKLGDYWLDFFPRSLIWAMLPVKRRFFLVG
jgi:hypothetical protein